MRVGSLLVLAVCLHAGAAVAAPALVSQSDPYPGIHRELWADSAVPWRLHLVRVDLTSAEIGLYATKESDRGQKTSSFAGLIDAQVAINGDAFAVADYRPRGLAMGDTSAWSNTADDIATAVLHFRRSGERTYATISPPEDVVSSQTLPAGTQGAISGRPLLLRAGMVVTPDCSDPITVACTRAPRTAVALSADGNRMWLAVVDGWQEASHGMRADELGAFLLARGAHAAIALDGGASSTLVLDGIVANAPSDGIERTVANHLAIKYGALPKGSMVGFICKTPDYPACGQDPALQITGAQVRLDDGRTVTTTGGGYFSFADVTPRLACITVRKAGFQTRVSCKTVMSGVPTYNSTHLEPGVDLPDAGVPDAGGDTEDAGTDPDGGTGTDGGFPGTGGGGGCCDTRGDLGGASSHLFLVAIVAWMLARRPGTRNKG